MNMSDMFNDLRNQAKNKIRNLEKDEYDKQKDIENRAREFLKEKVRIDFQTVINSGKLFKNTKEITISYDSYGFAYVELLPIRIPNWNTTVLDWDVIKKAVLLFGEEEGCIGRIKEYHNSPVPGDIHAEFTLKL